jgi:hypothetical protein
MPLAFFAGKAWSRVEAKPEDLPVACFRLAFGGRASGRHLSQSPPSEGCFFCSGAQKSVFSPRLDFCFCFCIGGHMEVPMKKIAYIAVILALITLGAAGCAYAPVNTAPKASGSSASSSEAISSSQPESSSSAVVSSSAAPSSPAVQSSSAPASSAPAVSSAASSAVTPKPANIITVNIDAQKDGGKTWSYPVVLQAGDSVFTVTKRLANEKKITISYSSSPSIFVQAINGYSYTDHGGLSGWLYTVNNDPQPGYSCEQYKTLKSGDIIKWRYTLDGK